jgi:choline dehydrogenase-like flavoprotein
MPVEIIAARMPAVGPALWRELQKLGHLAAWGVQVRARAHGRVRRDIFGVPRISYSMSAEDVATLKLAITRLAEMMFAAGAREVMPGVFGIPERVRSFDEMRAIADVPNDPRYFHCILSHLFGTATMGTDPRASVVAPDGQAHDLAGLYVADASVFPTNMGVNPQHSISAIAWLTAERIANQRATA